MTPRVRVCRMEIWLALLEAALEKGLIECEVVTWKRGSLPDSDMPQGLLAPDPRGRMHQQMLAARGSGGELVTWAYCLLLVLLGVLLNAALGHLFSK
jgi:hypothetical protein